MIDMEKKHKQTEKPQHDAKVHVISCCVEYMERGRLDNSEVQCERPAKFMVKAGSYNKDKFNPMCKRHRDIYKGRVKTLLNRWDVKAVYEETILQ